MANLIHPDTVRAWLRSDEAFAFLDVREHGQYGQAHPLFVSSVPFSRFEYLITERVPGRLVKVVLLDNDDGIAQRAAQCAQALGYEHVHIVAGGAPAWERAGHTLYAGVNVPSKAFAELMESARHTPGLTAEQVAALGDEGVDHVIVDGRPLTEFSRMSIPGAYCCPNGELALRIDDMVPDEKTTVVVNCAGRTRSIIGAQTLIDIGLKNPVYALENGTQGWVLAGLKRAHGATNQYPDPVSGQHQRMRREQARRCAERVGVSFVSAQQVSEWLADPGGCTYLLDVRTVEEFAHDGSPLSMHAPGGQLVQGTDEWIGVRGARIVLIDNDAIRAPMCGYWLAQMGHQVAVLDGGISACARIEARPAGAPAPYRARPLTVVEPAMLGNQSAQLVDLRGSMAFRQAHIVGSRWSTRVRIDQLPLLRHEPVVLIGPEWETTLVGADLTAQGFTDVARLTGDTDDWRSAGLPLQSTDGPGDADCIDHLFFTAQRHHGNEAHSRQYLEWEINLVNQLDEEERGMFRVAVP